MLNDRARLLLGEPDLPASAFLERAGGARPATLEGGGGGGSSSSSSTTVDKRQVVENGIGVTSDSSNVNVAATYTDYDSINKAIAFAEKSVAEGTKQLQQTIDLAKTSSEGTNKTFTDVIGFAEGVLGLTKENINLAIKNVDQISSAYSTVGDLSTGNRTIATTGLVIAGVVAAAFAFKGTKL